MRGRKARRPRRVNERRSFRYLTGREHLTPGLKNQLLESDPHHPASSIETIAPLHLVDNIVHLHIRYFLSLAMYFRFTLFFEAIQTTQLIETSGRRIHHPATLTNELVCRISFGIVRPPTLALPSSFDNQTRSSACS